MSLGDFEALILNMPKSEHAIPTDPSFSGEVSDSTFAPVLVDELTVLDVNRDIGSEKKSRPKKAKIKRSVCKNKGCHKLLRKDQRVVCSPECRSELVTNCFKLLKELEISADEYSDYLRLFA